MIVTALKGGLGNQMFQYALGRKLSLQNKDTLLLDASRLDTQHISADTYRPFGLYSFKINARVATEDELRAARSSISFFSLLAERIQIKIFQRWHVGWEPSILKHPGDLYLNGYWQSYKYFEDIRSTLLKDFQLRAPSAQFQDLQKERMDLSSVSIHIRRGDYVTNAASYASMGACSPQYYASAMAYISTKVPNPKWFVFSDDPAWVRENIMFPTEPVFISGNGISDAEELILMSICAHHIIANSTFSWWGAWLGTYPTATVVAPTPWSNTHTNWYADLIPPTWNSLPRN